MCLLKGNSEIPFWKEVLTTIVIPDTCQCASYRDDVFGVCSRLSSVNGIMLDCF